MTRQSWAVSFIFTVSCPFRFLRLLGRLAGGLGDGLGRHCANITAKVSLDQIVVEYGILYRLKGRQQIGRGADQAGTASTAVAFQVIHIRNYIRLVLYLDIVGGAILALRGLYCFPCLRRVLGIGYFRLRF